MATSRRTALAVLLSAGLLATACGGGDAGGGEAAPTDAVPLSEAPDARGRSGGPSQADPALQAYEQAKGYVNAGDLEGARGALGRAVELDPQFAEAWYQLGATETNLAIQTVYADESAAVQLFRDGVDHKRNAQSLMRQGSYRVWTRSQQDEAWYDLQQGLDGVDELLADEALLISALKMYAGGSG